MRTRNPLLALGLSMTVGLALCPPQGKAQSPVAEPDATCLPKNSYRKIDDLKYERTPQGQVNVLVSLKLWTGPQSPRRPSNAGCKVRFELYDPADLKNPIGQEESDPIEVPSGRLLKPVVPFTTQVPPGKDCVMKVFVVSTVPDRVQNADGTITAMDIKSARTISLKAKQ